MDVKLVIASGSKTGQAITVNIPQFFIGRADDCHLKPKSELVSRYHCAIVNEANYVGARDMQSKNGVYVNGEKISSERELKNGDLLVVGPLEFRVMLNMVQHVEKKPKVESVKQAVERTIEVASIPQPMVISNTPPVVNDGDPDVSDWLLGEDDELGGLETQTIELSHLTDDLKELHAEATDVPTDTDEIKRLDATVQQTPATPKGSANSRDAAANLLKNFFKGGR